VFLEQDLLRAEVVEDLNAWLDLLPKDLTLEVCEFLEVNEVGLARDALDCGMVDYAVTLLRSKGWTVEPPLSRGD
jgi:hypothetical protein